MNLGARSLILLTYQVPLLYNFIFIAAKKLVPAIGK